MGHMECAKVLLRNKAAANKENSGFWTGMQILSQSWRSVTAISSSISHSQVILGMLFHATLLILHASLEIKTEIFCRYADFFILKGLNVIKILFCTDDDFV